MASKYVHQQPSSFTARAHSLFELRFVAPKKKKKKKRLTTPQLLGQWFLAIVGLLASLLLYALDTTIVATIQPAIVTDFGRVDLVPWLAAAFALASAASTLPWSKAYGTFSAKKLFVGGTTLFMASSALCGAAPNINAFIVGRALLGIGGTGMYLGIMTILSVNTSEVERPRYLSMTGFFWGVGTVLGPVVGGAFAESAATWRCMFYGFTPLGSYSWRVIHSTWMSLIRGQQLT